MKRKIIGSIVVIIGLITLAYPKTSELYYTYEQDKIMEEWEQSMLNISSSEEIEPSEKELSKEYSEGEMQGTLKIDKIDLKLPILTRATHENLLTSLASIDDTGNPGQVGNYAVAGHRNLTYGRNFNRLEEVEVGDEIDFSDGENQYKYKVSEKLYVLPDEISVLDGNDKDKEISLVTCHPMGNPTHRLIIKGKVEE